MAKRKPKAPAEAELAGEAAHPGEAHLSGPPAGDPFDAAIADRAAGHFEQAPTPSSAEPPIEPEAPRHEPPKHVHREPSGFASRIEKQPDPFSENQISLTREDDGPKMRLYRNRYSNVMAIQFDEKPSDPIRQQLHQAGFSWRQPDRVWVKPLGQRPGEEHRRAEELFEGLASQIRTENGMPPIERRAMAEVPQVSWARG